MGRQELQFRRRIRRMTYRNKRRIFRVLRESGKWSFAHPFKQSFAVVGVGYLVGLQTECTWLARCSSIARGMLLFLFPPQFEVVCRVHHMFVPISDSHWSIL